MDRDTEKISLIGAVSIGIGGMVGGGIFAVLGEAVSISHGATPVAFLVAGVVALLTAVAYARLSVAYPNRGGTVFFIDTAFGNNLASGSVNLMLWLSYLVTIALYAVAFSAYAQTFFHAPVSSLEKHLLISAAILLPTLINLLSATFVSRSETLIVILKLLLLAVIIIASLPDIDPKRIEPGHWGTPLSIISAGMIIFVAYEGFELIANAAEDISDPRRNLPRAFLASVLIVIALYIVIAAITVSTVPEARLVAAKDYALAVAAEPALGQIGFVAVSVAALLATFSAINATIYGNARLGYTLAKEGELPETFDREVWNEPLPGVLITAAVSLLIANTIDMTEIAIIGSAGFLLIFALVNAAAYRLRHSIGGRGGIHLAALLLSVAALAVLLWHTYEENARAVLLFGAFIAISLLFEGLYGIRVRGHFLGRRYGKGGR
jgi:amino acid transporter